MRQDISERTVSCGASEIRYLLVRKKVKNVNLRIRPDGTVTVSAHGRVPVRVIDDFVREKQVFIFSALSEYEKRRDRVPKPVEEYTDGEKLRLLGQVLAIRVLKESAESVETEDGLFTIRVRNPENTAHKKHLAEQYVRRLRQEIFTEICEKTWPLFEPYGVVYPEVTIRTMKSRWGSCKPYRNAIALNARLIEYPRECIEYVVMHEFSHFIHPDHSKAFYSFMAGFMPDWKRRKELLNRMSAD